MKGCDSIQIETVDVQLPTNQLNEGVYRPNQRPHNFMGALLSWHTSSPTDTSSITLNNCNIQRTSIITTKASTPAQLHGSVESLWNLDIFRKVVDFDLGYLNGTSILDSLVL